MTTLPASAQQLPKTLADLRASGWKSRSVKEEVRENFLRMLRDRVELFPGIVGYDDTVKSTLLSWLATTCFFWVKKDRPRAA